MGKPYFSMEKFLERIELIQKEFNLPLDNDAAFDAFIGLSNKLSRWKSGQLGEPQIRTLQSIAKAANKSIDWLVAWENQLFLAEPQEKYAFPKLLSAAVRREIKLRLRRYLKNNQEILDLDREVHLELKLENYYRNTSELPEDQVIKAYLVECPLQLFEKG